MISSSSRIHSREECLNYENILALGSGLGLGMKRWMIDATKKDISLSATENK